MKEYLKTGKDFMTPRLDWLTFQAFNRILACIKGFGVREIHNDGVWFEVY